VSILGIYLRFFNIISEYKLITLIGLRYIFEVFLYECISTDITADKFGKPMTTRSATAKVISLPKVKDKSTNAAVSDTLVSTLDEALVLDDLPGSEQLGARGGPSDDISSEQESQDLQESEDTHGSSQRY